MNNSLYIDMLMSLCNYSTCLRRRTSAVIINTRGSIIGIGYNGAPEGVTPCTELHKCLRENQPRGSALDQCIAIHAETAALLDAMHKGLNAVGCKVICTDKPCLTCLKTLVAANIHQVEFLRDYPIVCSTAYKAIESKISLVQINLTTHFKDKSNNFDLSLKGDLTPAAFRKTKK